TNAQAHLRKSTRALGIVANAWLVKMDLKDAFPSVTERILRPIFANRIFCLRPPKEITRRKTPSGHRPAPDKIEREAVLAQRMFRERFVVGLRRVAAVSGLPIEELRLRFVDLMIYLTLWKGHLPQGAPTSPYLINVVLTETGVLNRLYEEANWRDCIFTMYCDDMTITCPFKPSRRFMTVLRKCLHGFFRINPEKTHVSSLRSQAHSITGLKLTRYARKEDIAWVRSNGGQVHITLAQRKIKRMRAVLHRITPFLLAGKEPIKEEDGASLDVAKGYIAHLTQVFGEKSNFPSAIKEPVRKFEEAYAKFCSLKTK
ncbi:MAG: reverse transcriptase domain-containing protein, partial [Candidatus Vogelbacteria bacterium]|nr:reverse transcriptase domain-containing protein [Candidatus Vogelbacteria bacterium]